MTRVLVLGGAGMLGSMLVAVLGADFEVVAAARDAQPAFDARRDDPGVLLDSVAPAWVVNAIGILDTRIDAADPVSIEQAIDVNGCFPQRLAAAAAARGVRVVHPATDAVFSGRDGPYDERAAHDGDGVYARSKSLGEAPGEHVVNLRCSILGPERGAPRSLLGRLLAQPAGARMTGYADQRWNGITTLHFARLCGAIAGGAGAPLHGAVHVVPADVVTKAQLLRLLATAHGREDVAIEDGPSPAPADRSLSTVDEQRNRALWRAAGYAEPPTVAAMVSELAARSQ